MRVAVDRIEVPAGETVGFGYGTDEEGRSTCFLGDAELLEQMEPFLAAGDAVVACIARWQIVERERV